MAAPNINERRKAVYKIRNNHTKKMIVELAAQFDCSITAIYFDLCNIKKLKDVTITASPKIKKHILERDERICQYCGKTHDKMVAEHVIPRINGGVAKPYNLVVACQSCNLLKRRDVYIPTNIDLLMTLNKDWAELIIKKAVLDCRISSPISRKKRYQKKVKKIKQNETAIQ